MCVRLQLLGDALAAMLSDIDRGSDSLTEREVVLQARSVYSACFFEVLRQVGPGVYILPLCGACVALVWRLCGACVALVWPVSQS
jgi:hypothetical protein